MRRPRLSPSVEKTEPVATRSPSSLMGKRICETKNCIDFKQHVGNPNRWHSAIQIQYGCRGTIWHVLCQPVGPQRSILYVTVRNGTFAGSIGEPRLPVCQLILWVGWHCQLCIFLRSDHRHQYLLEVAITPRMSEASQTYPERKASVKWRTPYRRRWAMRWAGMLFRTL